MPVVGMNYGFQNSARAAFESIAPPPLRNVGVEGRQFGGTTYDKAPAFAFDAMVSAFRRDQRPQGMTVAQVLDVIEATRSGSSAKKRHAVQDLSTMSS